MLEYENIVEMSDMNTFEQAWGGWRLRRNGDERFRCGLLNLLRPTQMNPIAL